MSNQETNQEGFNYGFSIANCKNGDTIHFKNHIESSEINYTLHKLNNGFIITNNELTYPGEIVYSTVTNTLVSFTDPRHFSEGTYFKVIAQQSNIIFSDLKEDECLRIGFFDINEIARVEWLKSTGQQSYCLGLHDGVKIGFQKALSLTSEKKFTLEDIHKAIDLARKEPRIMFGEIANSITPTSWQIEGHMEGDKFKITKIL
jgi:hypothetical protein